MVLWCYTVEGALMAYFLKKSNLKKGVYLQIYESFYNPSKNQTSHRSYKALGYVSDLQASGIDDPVSYYKAEVARMNEERKKEKPRLVSDLSCEKYLGHFLLSAIMNRLGVKRYFDILQMASGFDFSLYDVFSSLVYARAVSPCSKLRTYTEVLPCLFRTVDYSYDQLLSCVGYLGSEYEKFVELFTTCVSQKYPIDTERTYFDCTNFYFEIDREDDFRRKGPSKENRKDPIVGLGLLLDANQIPVGMKMYPGNESEKPVLRDVVDGLKKRHGFTGRTIQVADKGLNCAENIFNARQNGDGYIFSKSVKQLPHKEEVWVLLEKGYQSVCDSDGNMLYRWKECIGKFPYKYTDENGKTHKLELTEKRVVTFNPSLAKKKRLEILRMVAKAKQMSAAKAKRNEYGESSRYVIFKSTSKGKKTDDKVVTEINTKKVEEDLSLAGYNMIVTSETKMKAEEIYDTYHNLWRIEESFKIMKSDLDARPVYMRKEETIKGHFLICYIAVLLERLLQFKHLGGIYSTNKIIEFMKDFKVVEADGKYINVSRSSKLGNELSEAASLPLNHLILTKRDIQKVLNFRF